uniref:Uncharacterized protein n=2 Tax=Meloidogyne TaxID=189290 RepID=A0A6V7X8J3_MELEN|nr:unnamed protein product [Meloidogyne enterolobii]CAD2204647.1 unnamed protein product [Meloidogyne enterolobii]
MSSSKSNFDEINLNENITEQPKPDKTSFNTSSEPVIEQQNTPTIPKKSPKSSVSSGSISPVTPSSTPPLPAALTNPQSPAFYSLVSGIEIEESSGDDTFVEARSELMVKEENKEMVAETKQQYQQQQPPKPPRQADIVNSATLETNIEEKQEKVVQQSNKPNELPMLPIAPNAGNEVPPSPLPSDQQPKQHSPPPNYTSVYPPLSQPTGQLPPSCFAGTQGGSVYTPKATYYIDGNVGGPAIIISQGESKIATPVFLFAPDPYGEEYLRRRRALSFLSCTLILLPLFTLLLIILSWGSYYY